MVMFMTFVVVFVMMFVMVLMGAALAVMMFMKMCHIFAVSLISRCKGTAISLQLSCKVVFYSPAEIKEIKEIIYLTQNLCP